MVTVAADGNYTAIKWKSRVVVVLVIVVVVVVEV